MIYVIQTGGRLGNILFQTAAAVSLSKDVTLCDINSNQKEYINQFSETILRKIKVIDGYPDCTNIYKQPSFRYEKIPHQDNEDIALVGSFQSEKYFDKNAVRELYEIDEKTQKFINENYGHLFKEEITGIHVRRGDYMKFPHRWIFCGKKYYMDAIKLMGKDKRYLVCSDDIAWCKKNFKGDNFYFVENTSPIIDLYIQASCTNNIMSNSTFSWWAAWLNSNPDKIVIAPKRWFGIDFNLDIRDMIPATYITLDNKNYYRRYVYGNYKKYEELLIIRLQNSFLRSTLRRLRNLVVRS